METRVDTRERWERRLLDPSVLRTVARHDSDAAEWFEQARWPHRVECLRCGSEETSVLSRIYGGASPRPEHRREWRCAKCECVFTVREDTFLEDSDVPLSAWCVALRMALEPGGEDPEVELVEQWGIDEEAVAPLMERAQEVVESCGLVGVPKVPYESPEDEDLAMDSELPTGSPFFSGQARSKSIESNRRRQLIHLATILLVCSAIWWGGTTYLSYSRSILTYRWTNAEGVPMHLETWREAGETRAQWERRHERRVSSIEITLAEN